MDNEDSMRAGLHRSLAEIKNIIYRPPEWESWQLGSYVAYKVLRQWLITLITGSDNEWRRR
jgi:hypothetical protein